PEGRAAGTRTTRHLRESGTSRRRGRRSAVRARVAAWSPPYGKEGQRSCRQCTLCGGSRKQNGAARSRGTARRLHSRKTLGREELAPLLECPSQIGHLLAQRGASAAEAPIVCGEARDVPDQSQESLCALDQLEIGDDQPVGLGVTHE